MSQEIEVGVRVAYKVNMGNYENADVEVSFKTIIEGNKADAVLKYNQLYDTAWELIVEKAQEIKATDV